MKKLIALFILNGALTCSINAQSLTISLSGTNITCYNARNGSVNLTVSGGTSPYTFQWSNGATTEDINTLSPSYYAVTVTDAASNTAMDGVTLTEPSQITFSFTLSDYIVNGSHYNLSSYSWQNGSITTSVSGSVPPYTYSWTNGATTANLSSLDAGSYRLVVTDAAGCIKGSETLVLTKPDRSDWTMTGNSGSNPSTNFIGTTDNRDFVFKTNNDERMRIKSNGQLQFVTGTLKVDTVSTDSARVAYIDQNGVLKSIGGSSSGGPQPCKTLTNRWYTDYCNAANDIYNNPSSGNVGIGITTPYGKLHVLGNAVFSNTPNAFGIAGAAMIHGNTGVSSASSPDYTWVANPNTGIFHPGSDIIAFTNGGSESMRIHSSGNISIGTTTITTGFMLQVNGNTKTNGLEASAFKMTASPASGYVLKSDGIGNASWADINTLNITGDNMGNNTATPGMDVQLNNNWLNNNGGTNEGIRIDDNGNVGIGTSNPAELVQFGDRFVFHNGGTKVFGRNFKYIGASPAHVERLIANEPVCVIAYDAGGNIYFDMAPSGPVGTPVTMTTAMRIANNGTVGIGTDPTANNASTYKLVVGGKLGANELWAAVGTWPDYVFKKEYCLKSLEELQKFIKTEKHLPGMPSAKEVTEQDKINLGNMQIKLLEKTEEAYLYILELKKEIDQLKVENKKVMDFVQKKAKK